MNEVVQNSVVAVSSDKPRVVDVKKIRKMIWNATGDTAMDAVNKYHKKCYGFFPEPKSIDEANDILQIFADAWNCFPHKELGGKSPDQKVGEALKNMPKQKTDSQKMPKMIVGGVEMEWDDYWAMIREMEKVQVPFKKWIDDEFLPKYKNDPKCECLRASLAMSPCNFKISI